MKVHAKLGGVTHAVPQPTTLDSKTLMIGADVSATQLYNTTYANSQVTHPPAKKFGAIPPSVAVTVASISGDQNLFWPAIRLQEGRK